MKQHGPLSRGAFAIAVLISLAVLFTPADGVPFAPPGVDKVVHLVLFAVLALTGRWAGIGRSVLVTVLVSYAAISEVLQGVTALDRSASLADWVADVAGIVAGLVLWQVLASRRDRTV